MKDWEPFIRSYPVEFEKSKSSKMLARVIKVFAILIIGWALGYAHCWFALMKG